MDLSIIIPCYCSKDNIEQVLKQIDGVMSTESLSYEIIMVNDSSPDNTYEIISTLALTRKNTIAVDLAKNCGQHAAIMAGFQLAKGELIATCEDDGQTLIEILPEMIKKLYDDNYDVVAPKLLDRGKRSLARRFGSWCAAAMGNWMISRPKGMIVPIYFVARRFIIEEITRYKQPYPYMEGLILRSTYNIGYVDAMQKERLSGASGYNFKKLLNLWLNGFTSFSIKPLRASVLLGMLSALLGIIVGVIVIIRKVIGIDVQLGWSSIIAIMLFMFGIVLVVLGMIGEYIGRIYICINQSPQYVIRQTAGQVEKEL